MFSFLHPWTVCRQSSYIYIALYFCKYLNTCKAQEPPRASPQVESVIPESTTLSYFIGSQEIQILGFHFYFALLFLFVFSIHLLNTAVMVPRPLFDILQQVPGEWSFTPDWPQYMTTVYKPNRPDLGLLPSTTCHSHQTNKHTLPLHLIICCLLVWLLQNKKIWFLAFGSISRLLRHGFRLLNSKCFSLPLCFFHLCLMENTLNFLMFVLCCVEIKLLFLVRKRAFWVLILALKQLHYVQAGGANSSRRDSSGPLALNLTHLKLSPQQEQKVNRQNSHNI